ncbi:MAG: GGDEF domain-containing phosphodiesterase [Planctomycetota bacterium]
MKPAPLLVALNDANVARLLAEELEASGVKFEETRDADRLFERMDAASHVVLDPSLCPDGKAASVFVAEVVAAGAAVVAQVTKDLDEDTLVALGARDVFTAGTCPELVLRRLGEIPCSRDEAAEEVAAPDRSDERAAAAAAFIERVAIRLTRARDRERSVAIFCVALHGVTSSDPQRTLRQVLEAVLEDLDRSEDVSYAARRILISAVDDGVFAVLVPDVERVQDAARLGVRLHEALALRSGVVANIGIACSPDDGTVAQELVDRARAAVLRARQTGENHVEFFSESMSRWAFERLTLEQSLRDALHNRELTVFYQPRIDIESRQIIGMEALVRWIHPQFGLVSPGQFIPLAEETGLIVPIGEWILREACRQNAEWRALGLPRIRVSVNLSPVQFRKTTLHETVCSALEDAKLDADGLELEVTESLLMNDPAETASVLGRFRALGIHISIDDFGTGYSSLSYLKRFPINSLKIDRSFITDVTSNPDDAAITTAIILMGHSLRLNVVAEGVETENQLAFLKVLQCNEVQGYLFSPPVPADRAQRMLGDQVEASRNAA